MEKIRLKFSMAILHLLSTLLLLETAYGSASYDQITKLAHQILFLRTCANLSVYHTYVVLSILMFQCLIIRTLCTVYKYPEPVNLVLWFQIYFLFITDSVARLRAYYGQGSVPILLDDVRCTGTESRLIDCTYTAIDNCVHSEDAGIDCTTSNELAIYSCMITNTNGLLCQESQFLCTIRCALVKHKYIRHIYNILNLTHIYIYIFQSSKRPNTFSNKDSTKTLSSLLDYQL